MDMSDPNDILEELRTKGVIDNEVIVDRQLRGTTEGKVYVLALHGKPVQVLKFDEPRQIECAAHFLLAYRDVPLLPKVHYTDPHKTFFIYSYVPGVTNGQRSAKTEWLPMISVQLIGRYKYTVPPASGWGWMDAPSPSWRQFNLQRLAESRPVIGNVLPEEDYAAVRKFAEEAAWYERLEQPYLLHGDCGVHNFLFDGFRLAGLIDPLPVLGPPIHDLLFAFCSSPDDLSLDTLLSGYSALKDIPEHNALDLPFLMKETMIHLYCRIATCLIYHPQDLPLYLEAWDAWKRMLS